MKAVRLYPVYISGAIDTIKAGKMDGELWFNTVQLAKVLGLFEFNVLRNCPSVVILATCTGMWRRDERFVPGGEVQKLARRFKKKAVADRLDEYITQSMQKFDQWPYVPGASTRGMVLQGLLPGAEPTQSKSCFTCGKRRKCSINHLAGCPKKRIIWIGDRYE
jgi:hypothetical protein